MALPCAAELTERRSGPQSGHRHRDRVRTACGHVRRRCLSGHGAERRRVQRLAGEHRHGCRGQPLSASICLAVLGASLDAGASVGVVSRTAAVDRCGVRPTGTTLARTRAGLLVRRRPRAHGAVMTTPAPCRGGRLGPSPDRHEDSPPVSLVTFVVLAVGATWAVWIPRALGAGGGRRAALDVDRLAGRDRRGAGGRGSGRAAATCSPAWCGGASAGAVRRRPARSRGCSPPSSPAWARCSALRGTRATRCMFTAEPTGRRCRSSSSSRPSRTGWARSSVAWLRAAPAAVTSDALVAKSRAGRGLGGVAPAARVDARRRALPTTPLVARRGPHGEGR